MVRVYAGPDHNVMTLQSNLALPPSAFKPLSRCVHEELANEFDRAIFLAGAPAQSEEDIGTVKAITTAEELEADIQNAGIELAEGTGLVGELPVPSPTTAIITMCRQRYWSFMRIHISQIRGRPISYRRRTGTVDGF